MFKLPFDTPYSFDELLSFTNSQAKQDLFVLAMFEGKTNGTFLEIGAGEPVTASNCQLLEKYFDWTGVSIDNRDKSHLGWPELRSKSNYVVADATTYDYSVLPNYFDYLQIDIDDPEGQTKLLQLLDDKDFGVITLEHDVYRKKPRFFAWKNFAIRTLVKKGYVILANNVCVDRGDNKASCFEDWYVNPNVIRKEVIETYKNFTWDYELKNGEDVLFTNT